MLVMYLERGVFSTFLFNFTFSDVTVTLKNEKINNRQSRDDG